MSVDFYCEYCARDLEEGDEYIVFNGDIFCDDDCLLNSLYDSGAIVTKQVGNDLM